MPTRPPQGVGRRALLQGGAAALAAPAILARRAAAATQITVADPGGPYGPAFRKAFYDPFEKATGTRVNNVAREPDPIAQFKAMVESHSYIWDVCNLAISSRDVLAQQNLLEPLGIADAGVPGLMPGALSPLWMGTDVYGVILAYRTDRMGAHAPQSWADFWDVKQFPGNRCLFKSAWFTLEEALLADGVAPDKLYPLDVDRAFRKLDEIKPHITAWWTGGAQSTQLIQSGEVDMIAQFSARAQAAADGGAPVKICWNQGLYGIEGWGVPRGCPRADAARDFVKFCADPQRQASFTEVLSYGPTNLEAYKSIPQPRAETLPTYSENLKRMIPASDAWWATHRSEVYQRFDTWLIG